jgi:hypothetical protein
MWVGLFDEAVDGGLEVGDGGERAALEASACELGEEAFDSMAHGFWSMGFGITQQALRFGFWLFERRPRPLFDWNAATPWWISSFVPNLEAELGLALMFASMIPTLPWARLFPFAALLVFAAVTLAWWGFLALLIWHWFRDRRVPLMRTFPSINRALTILCDHPGMKAVTTFLVNHVNRASHLRSATNGAMPPQGHAASRSQHDPARVLALVGSTLGLAARIANLQTTP